ncbi:MAG: hydroxymethylglutaryl-CoA lyase, partial [Synergistetes bacterium HGW-Synergistetes-2]
LHEMGVDTGIDLDKMLGLAGELRGWVEHDTDSALLKAGPCCRPVPRDGVAKQ